MEVVYDQLPIYTVSPKFSSPCDEVVVDRGRIKLTFTMTPPNPEVKFVLPHQVLSQPYGIYFRVQD